jgi:hypothetical protein
MQSRLSRKVLALSMIPIAFYSWSASAQIYTKLTNGDPLIHISNGVGAEDILFLRSAGTDIPDRVKTTGAIGHINTVPATDIQVSAPATVDGNVFKLSVGVRTGIYMEPNVAYEGTILLFPKNGETPVPIKFRVQDDSIIAFEVTPTTIAATISDKTSDRQRIHLKNTGKTIINSVRVTSSNFTNTANTHRVVLQSADNQVRLPPGKSTDLEFDLPQPSWAGTYTGTILVEANSTVGIPIAATLQTRGPWNKYHGPFLLFILVVAAGFSISSLLDAWFGSGGLARAQAYLSLKDAEKQLATVATQIRQWNLELKTFVPPSEISQADLWIAVKLCELGKIWDGFDANPVDQLTNAADGYVVLGDAANSFSSHVTVAISHWSDDPAILEKVLTALDAVALPASRADLIRYRRDLDVVLTTPSAVAKQVASVAASALTPKITIADRLRSKIHAMKDLYQVVVCFVVFITAYLSFYAGHLAFGTCADYLAVVLWSLGLTTTGTQIISHVHKP